MTSQSEIVQDLSVGLQTLLEVLNASATDLSDVPTDMRAGLFDAMGAMVERAQRLQQLGVGEQDELMPEFVLTLQQIQAKFAPPTLLKSAFYRAAPGESAIALYRLTIPTITALVTAFPPQTSTNESGGTTQTKVPTDSGTTKSGPIFKSRVKPVQESVPQIKPEPASPPPPGKDCSIPLVTRRGNAGTLVRVCDLPQAAQQPLSGPPVVAPSPSATPWVVAVLAAGGLGFYFKNRKPKKASS